MHKTQLQLTAPSAPWNDQDVQSHLQARLNVAHDALGQLQKPKQMAALVTAAQSLFQCFRRGNKVLIAGNGGSLCDAMHMAEELTGYFHKQRPALAAIALSDPGHLTCVANDVDFEWVFARGVEALGKPEDLFIGLSTSGNSQNIVRAFTTAKDCGLTTLAFLGQSGGAVKGVADIELIVEGNLPSERIQEVHMTAIHLMIELCEHWLFSHCSNAQKR